MTIRRGVAHALAALLVLAFVVESMRAARVDSVVEGEAAQLAGGYAILRTGGPVLDIEDLAPAKALLALPLLAVDPDLDRASEGFRTGNGRLTGTEFLWENRVTPVRILGAGRAVAILASAVLLALVYAGATWLYGFPAGLLALFAAATCPDLLGHGHLATLDMLAALAALVALAMFLSFAVRPSRPRHVALTLALAFVLVTGAGAARVVAALFVAAVVRGLCDPALARRGRVRIPAPFAGNPRLAALFVLLGGLALAAAYAVALLALAHGAAPGALVAGLARRAFLIGEGRTSYLLGAISARPFASYYLIALGMKTPLLAIGLFATALATWPVLRLGRDQAEGTALAFVTGLLILASASSFQTGTVDVLAVYPVLFVFSARVMRASVGDFTRIAMAAVFVGGSAGVVAGASPAYLSYMNEGVGGPRRAIRGIADRNLDHGQDLGRLAGWLKSRGGPVVRLGVNSSAPPERFGIRYQALPVAGPVLPPPPYLAEADSSDLIVLSANALVGLFLPGDWYGWLRTREPVAVIGSIWVFALDPGQDDHRRLGRVYQAARWERYAAHEERLAEAWLARKKQGR